ncbi:MAG: GntR family transcriptional regulator [Sphingobacterium sp.]|uniref:GntR family transcriptional regulator n=1 Tax=Sphingobacterium sp. JB170 TaxID=1434842 RepID=UPI00097F4E83|nr:GntR family transcriptional regulator [Sphingobacterium sp. JB170]SJN48806.1 Predicted transcriptional regulator of N-Acetylglucosamine utilization, GntR family [Sphingobacterium sp. JB170]
MKVSIDHSSAVPLHIQVEQLLRKMVDSTEYSEGKLLPNEVNLAKRLAISRTTLRQAINKLVYEGLLIRKKGVGTWVNDNRSLSTKSKNWLSFSQEMAARGIPIRNFELHVSWVTPDQELSNFFEIKKDKKILKLVRLRGTIEGPFVYFVSYFHPRVNLTGEEDFKLPLYEMLERTHAVVADKSMEEIGARAAGDFLAEKLEIDAHQPVLFRKRHVYDQGGRPIEFNLGYYNAESFTYTVESTRD